jgi:hypothetical protein
VGSGDHQAAVAAAEIVDDVLGRYRRQPEHLHADLLRRGDEENVGTRIARSEIRASGQRHQRSHDQGQAVASGARRERRGLSR